MRDTQLIQVQPLCSANAAQSSPGTGADSINLAQQDNPSLREPVPECGDLSSARAQEDRTGAQMGRWELQKTENHRHRSISSSTYRWLIAQKRPTKSPSRKWPGERKA